MQTELKPILLYHRGFGSISLCKYHTGSHWRASYHHIMFKGAVLFHWLWFIIAQTLNNYVSTSLFCFYTNELNLNTFNIWIWLIHVASLLIYPWIFSASQTNGSHKPSVWYYCLEFAERSTFLVRFSWFIQNCSPRFPYAGF